MLHSWFRFKISFQLVSIFMLFSLYSFSQNKQLLFGFTEIPQSLMVNPGAKTNFKSHLGIPGLSGLSFNYGATGVTAADLFFDDGALFNTKFQNVLNQLSERDFVSINTQIELFSRGWRLNDKTYMSVGYYQELDVIAYMPKDLVELFHFGNNRAVYKTTHFSQLRVRAEFLGVFHVGMSKVVTSKLHIGGRFKLYSGSANIQSNNNTGVFATVEGENNMYKHYLSAINTEINTAGVYKGDATILEVKDLISNALVPKNIGVGIDLGFTYRYAPQVEITGSLLDIGFVNYSNAANTIKTKGDFEFEGISFLYDGANTNYWDELRADLKTQLPTEEDTNSYIAWRPLKLNAAIKYSFGAERIEVPSYDVTYEKEEDPTDVNPWEVKYHSAIGFQLYGVTRPLSNQIAATAFYERSFGKKNQAKFTYTIDDFSYSNFGVGVSTYIGAFQMYGMVDNILELYDVIYTNSASLQIGFNLIF